MAVGIVSMLMGVRLYRPWIALNGAVYGFITGMWLAQEISGESWVSITIAVITAIIFAILSYRFYKVGFVISGALVGALIVVILSGFISIGSDLTVLIAMAAGAILFGLLAVKLMKPYIIATSSFSGSLSFAIGLGYLINGNLTATILDVDLMRPDNVSYHWYLIALIIVLMVIGIIIQSKKFSGLTMDEITAF